MTGANGGTEVVRPPRLGRRRVLLAVVLTVVFAGVVIYLVDDHGAEKVKDVTVEGLTFVKPPDGAFDVSQKRTSSVCGEGLGQIEPPKVIESFRYNGPVDSVIRYYDSNLKQEGWRQRSGDNYYVRDKLRSTYSYRGQSGDQLLTFKLTFVDNDNFFEAIIVRDNFTDC